jgi:D-alanine-D-alanine ligase
MHRHLVPPAAIEEGTDITAAPWRTEYDVVSTLGAMGHEVQALPVHDDLGDIRRMAAEWKPHIAFNLLEGFDDITIFDQNVVSHLELLKLPYTGCNPRCSRATSRCRKNCSPTTASRSLSSRCSGSGAPSGARSGSPSR